MKSATHPEPAEVLQFPFPMPEFGHVTEVAAGVYWIRTPLPLVLNHINLWLLRDGDGWTIVDCGFNSDEAREIWEQVFSTMLEGRPVRRVIATHFHPDHIGLSVWLCRRFGVELTITESEYLMAHAVFGSTSGIGTDPTFGLCRRHGLDEARLAELTEFGSNYRVWTKELPNSFRRIKAGESLTIDGRTWQVHVGHGHSPEHASLHCAALGLLISGDMMLPRITTNVSVRAVEPDGNPLREFLDSVEAYRSLPEDTLVLPSHGLVFRGLHARIGQLHDHHADRLRALELALAQPHTAAEVVPVLFHRKIEGRQWFFAMGEAIAHLNLLWHAGVVRRIADAGGVYRFRATHNR